MNSAWDFPSAFPFGLSVRYLSSLAWAFLLVDVYASFTYSEVPSSYWICTLAKLYAIVLGMLTKFNTIEFGVRSSTPRLEFSGRKKNYSYLLRWKPDPAVNFRFLGSWSGAD